MQVCVQMSGLTERSRESEERLGSGRERPNGASAAQQCLPVSLQLCGAIGVTCLTTLVMESSVSTPFAASGRLPNPSVWLCRSSGEKAGDDLSSPPTVPSALPTMVPSPLPSSGK